MTPRGLQRLAEWENGAHPRSPMTYASEFDFPNSTWVFEDKNSTLPVHLKAIDRGFRIFYDFTTVTDKMSPAHFLYRLIPGMKDHYVLEFALQYDLSMSWPNGTPRAPGKWLLQAIADRDKARMQGSEEQIEKQCSDARVAAAEKKPMAEAKEMAEMNAHFEEEMAPYAKRGRKLGSVHGGEHRKRGPKGPKIIVPMTADKA